MRFLLCALVVAACACACAGQDGLSEVETGKSGSVVNATVLNATSASEPASKVNSLATNPLTLHYTTSVMPQGRFAVGRTRVGFASAAAVTVQAADAMLTPGLYNVASVGRAACAQWLSVQPCTGTSNAPDMYNNTDSINQQWRFELVPGSVNTFYISSLSRQACRRFLSVPQCGTNNVDLWNVAGTNQAWQLVPTGQPDEYNLKSTARASTTDCRSWMSVQKCADWSIVDLWSDNDSPNQAFKITPAPCTVANCQVCLSSTACAVCKAGYNLLNGQCSTAVVCPAPVCSTNLVATLGTCVSGPGEYCSGVPLSCKACARGFFSPGGSVQQPFPLCQACPAGFTTPATCSTNQKANCTVSICLAGTGGTGCAPCSVGTFSLGGSKEDPQPACGACPTGKTNALPGSSACLISICLPGFARSQPGVACVACERDSFSAGGTTKAPDGQCVACPPTSKTYAAPGLAVSQDYCLTSGVIPVDLTSMINGATTSAVMLAGVYGYYTLLPAWLSAVSTAEAASQLAAGLEDTAATLGCALCAAEWFGSVVPKGPAACEYAKQFKKMTNTVKSKRTSQAFEAVMKGLSIEDKVVSRVLNDGYVTLDQVQKLLPQGAKNVFKSSQNYPEGFKFKLQDMQFGGQQWYTYIRGHAPKAAGKDTGFLSNKIWTLRVEICVTLGCDEGDIWRLAKDGVWAKPEGLAAEALAAHEDVTHIPLFMPKDKPKWTVPDCKFLT